MSNKTINTQANITYSEDYTKRYILDVSWDNSLPTATVIM